MDKKEQTACFTGHRKFNIIEYIKIKIKLNKEIKELINKGVKYFGCGGAIGFDILAGMTIIKLKRKYKDIFLILVLPCRNQDLYWTKRQKKRYKFLLENADKITYESVYYNKNCIFARNRHLVEHSKYCICYLRNEVSGTGYTVKYAKSKNLKIIYI